jgi:DNA-binding NarL/FixJ family response regulator
MDVVTRNLVAWPGGVTDVAVLVVDDHAVFRRAASDVVHATPGMTLVGEATSGEDAIAAVAELSPQLVVMDKRMPGIGGLQAARVINARFPGVAVLLVSVEPPAVDVRETGAVAFLPKRRLSPRVLAEMWATYGADRVRSADLDGAIPLQQSG